MELLAESLSTLRQRSSYMHNMSKRLLDCGQPDKILHASAIG